jgi:hypothetical protein
MQYAAAVAVVAMYYVERSESFIIPGEAEIRNEIRMKYSDLPYSS